MLITSLPPPRLCFDICICRLCGACFIDNVPLRWLLVAIVVAPIQRVKKAQNRFSLEMMMVRCETIGKKQKQKQQPNGWLFNRVGTDRALLRLRQRVTTGAVEPDSKARRRA
jgi:hypothetical protein